RDTGGLEHGPHRAVTYKHSRTEEVDRVLLLIAATAALSHHASPRLCPATKIWGRSRQSLVWKHRRGRMLSIAPTTCGRNQAAEGRQFAAPIHRRRTVVGACPPPAGVFGEYGSERTEPESGQQAFAVPGEVLAGRGVRFTTGAVVRPTA